MSYDAADYAEKLIATIARLMFRRGKSLEVDVLKQSTGVLNWDSEDFGVVYHLLNLEVSIDLYEQLPGDKVTIEQSIASVANEIINHNNEIINGVKIVPRLEAPENWRENLFSLSTSQFGMPKLDAKYKSDIFMLMPFSDNTLDLVYRDHICTLAESMGLSIKRADDFFDRQSIVGDIWSAINAARVIIADCTGKNPNVFYELGISHTLGKNTIIITHKPDDVPSDLKQLRYIEYVPSSEGLRTFKIKLEQAIRNLLEEDKPQPQDPYSIMDDIPF